MAFEAPPRITLVADRFRLEQALRNMVENALRHGDGTVRLVAREVDGQVELHVIDGGRGFPSAFVERAFDRFSRPDGRTARVAAGSASRSSTPSRARTGGRHTP